MAVLRGRYTAVAYRGGRGFFGVQPPPEIPKALQNRAKLNPIVHCKKLLNLGRHHPKIFGKKGSKILKLPRLAIVLL